MNVRFVTQATPAGPARSNRAAMDLARWTATLALSAVGLTACTASESEVRPDPDRLFFPTALTVAPDDSVAFVVSANSDLTYDSGTVQPIDLATVAQVVEAWRTSRTIPADCAVASDSTETLACPAKPFLIDGAGVRIGNFATSIATQDLGGGKLRLLVPVRGDPSVTWMDWDPADRHLRCSSDAGFALCDDDHRIVELTGPSDPPGLATEPYAVFVDSLAGFAVVAHLDNGVVSLIDSPVDGAPTLVDAVAVGISGGLSAIAGRKPGTDDVFYAQSNVDDRVFLLSALRQSGRQPFLISGGFFFQNGVGGSSTVGGIGADARGLVFRGGGDRAYFIGRAPPALLRYDTSIGATGVPLNRLVASTDICRRASGVAAADPGDGERAYVTCYTDGRLNVIDPRSGGTVEATPLTGQGPSAVAAVPSRRLVLVTNFFDDTVAVVDVDPASPYRNRVVLRLGGKS